MKAGLILGLVLALVAYVYSWADTGHVVVAEIARRGLSEEKETSINALLHTYTEYFKDSDVIRLPYCATFMDYIKKDTSLFDTMHYIDYPYVLDGTFPEQTIDATNALSALTNAAKTLIYHKDPQSIAWSKSFALLLSIHVLGDLHQPLHAVTMFSEKLALPPPIGDMGGNKYHISYEGQDGTKYTQMHLLFDCIAGKDCQYMPHPVTSTYQDQVSVYADELMAKYPKQALIDEGYDLEPELPDVKVFNKVVEKWTLESFELAKTAYADIAYNTVFTHDSEILKKYQDILEKRIALAGYRTEHILKLVNTEIIDYDPEVVIIKENGVSSMWKTAAIVMVVFFALAVLVAAVLYRKFSQIRLNNVDVNSTPYYMST